MSDEVKTRGDAFDYEHTPGTLFVCVVYKFAAVWGCMPLDDVDATIEHGDSLVLETSSEPEAADMLRCWIIGEMQSSKHRDKDVWAAILHTAVWLIAKTCTDFNGTQVDLRKDAIVYLFLREHFSNGKHLVGWNTVITPSNVPILDIIQKYYGEPGASLLSASILRSWKAQRKENDEHVRRQEKQRVAKEAQLAVEADLAKRTEEQRRKQAEHRAAAAAAAVEQARLDKIRREAAEEAGRLALERKAKLATLPSQPAEVKARIKARKVKAAAEIKTTQPWRWERWINSRGVG